MATATTERAVPAGGCFWKTQDLIHLLDTGDGERRTPRRRSLTSTPRGCGREAVTEVSAAGPFWEAQPEHQDYLERYPNGYTCHYVRPK
jgi:peptide methionine sulfoxide reductase MsrA